MAKTVVLWEGPHGRVGRRATSDARPKDGTPARTVQAPHASPRTHRMSLTKERKASLIQQHRRSAADSGSPEVQIAVLTAKIGELTEHLRTHKKDYASRRGLLMMVSRRRSLLDYLKRIEPQRYVDILRRLDIRK